jgi:hypothetical protein
VDLLVGAIQVPLLVGGGIGHGFSRDRSGKGCPGR